MIWEYLIEQFQIIWNQFHILKVRNKETELNDNTVFITPVPSLSDHVAHEGQHLVSDTFQIVNEKKI